jgi:3-oxoacyl-[acyl-carrier-protein] synthase III
MTAYITATGRYLPGDPVTNNEIDKNQQSVEAAYSKGNAA